MIADDVPILFETDGRQVKVWAVSDVHIGAAECDLEGFEKFIKNVEKDADSFLILCGDIINNGVKDSLTNVYEEVMPPSAQIEKAVELLRPVKDRIIAVVGGNHELRSKKAVDLDPMHTICVMLGIHERYRQSMAFVRFKLVSGGTRSAYAFFVTHGASTAKRRKFEYALEGVDVVFSGHVHDGIVERPCRLVFTHKNNVVVRNTISVVASSWLKYGGYAARAMHQPRTTSRPQCLVIDFSNTNGWRGDMRVVW